MGNVSTLAIGGLFKGALVGTQAYADYVNSTGGVNGRKIVVDTADDGFTGAGNKQATQNAITNDFALVGGFSLQDSFGGAVLAAEPGDARRLQVLDIPTTKLPNVYSAVPLLGGWQEGPLQYFKQKFPNDVDGVGTVVADLPSAQVDWAGEKYVMQKVGYKVVYDPSVPVTQTDFTQNVIAMKNAGVKILFIDQMPENYASAMLKDLQEQNFHPQVVLGAATYSNDLVSASGGPQAVDGSHVDQNTSLYLGQDYPAIPAVGTFLHWVQQTDPGSSPTCSPSTDGCPPSSSPRRSGTRAPTRAAARCSRRCPRSPPSTAATSWPPATRRPRPSQLLPARPGVRTASTSGWTTRRSTAPPTGTVATTPT